MNIGYEYFAYFLSKRQQSIIWSEWQFPLYKAIQPKCQPQKSNRRTDMDLTWKLKSVKIVNDN